MVNFINGVPFTPTCEIKTNKQITHQTQQWDKTVPESLLQMNCISKEIALEGEERISYADGEITRALMKVESPTTL